MGVGGFIYDSTARCLLLVCMQVLRIKLAIERNECICFHMTLSQSQGISLVSLVALAALHYHSPVSCIQSTRHIVRRNQRRLVGLPDLVSPYSLTHLKNQRSKLTSAPAAKPYQQTPPHPPKGPPVPPLPQNVLPSHALYT